MTNQIYIFSNNSFPKSEQTPRIIYSVSLSLNNETNFKRCFSAKYLVRSLTELNTQLCHNKCKSIMAANYTEHVIIKVVVY